MRGLGTGVLSFSQNTPAAVSPGSRLKQSAAATTRRLDPKYPRVATTRPSTPHAVAAVGRALVAAIPKRIAGTRLRTSRDAHAHTRFSVSRTNATPQALASS